MSFTFQLFCCRCTSYLIALFRLFSYSRYTAGPRPLDLFMKAMPVRLLMGLVFAGIVWWTTVAGGSGLSTLYYVVLIITFVIHQV